MNEQLRLEELDTYQLMDSFAEKEFDNMVELASAICEMPISLITLLDTNRQWFKANIGLNVDETPKAVSFCQYALNSPEELLIVDNPMEDERFKENPLVTGYPHIRYYAGAPLVTKNGFVLGTLCVIDSKARNLSPEKLNALKIIADKTVSMFEDRRKNILLQAERANAQENLLLYKLAIENSFDAVLIGKKGDEFNPIIYANTAFTKLTGYNLEEVEGKSGAILFGPNTNLDDVEILRNSMILNKPVSTELSCYKKDGTLIELSIRVSSILDEQNQLTHYVSVLQDVTELKKNAKLLIDTNNRLTALFNSSSNIAIIMTDSSGILTDFNIGAEKMLGYKAPELVGKSSPNVFQVQAEIDAYINKLEQEYGKELLKDGRITFKASRGEIDVKEWTYVRKDGSQFEVLLSLSAIKNNEGVITNYLGIAYDISLLKAYEKSIQHQASQLQKIAWTQSHILRAPLVRMMGLIEMIQEGELEKDTQNELMENVLQSSYEFDEIVRNIIVEAEKSKCN